MASLKKRGSSFYIQFYVAGNKQKRFNLRADSYRIAKEKLRRLSRLELRVMTFRSPLERPFQIS